MTAAHRLADRATDELVALMVQNIHAQADDMDWMLRLAAESGDMSVSDAAHRHLRTWA